MEVFTERKVYFHFYKYLKMKSLETFTKLKSRF